MKGGTGYPAIEYRKRIRISKKIGPNPYFEKGSENSDEKSLKIERFCKTIILTLKYRFYYKKKPSFSRRSDPYSVFVEGRIRIWFFVEGRIRVTGS